MIKQGYVETHDVGSHPINLEFTMEIEEAFKIMQDQGRIFMLSDFAFERTTFCEPPILGITNITFVPGRGILDVYIDDVEKPENPAIELLRWLYKKLAHQYGDVTEPRKKIKEFLDEYAR